MSGIDDLLSIADTEEQRAAEARAAAGTSGATTRGDRAPQAEREAPTAPPGTGSDTARAPLSLAESIRRRMAANPKRPLTDQEAVQVMALELVPTIQASREIGKWPKDEHWWDQAVDVAAQGFHTRFGRAPRPDSGPHLETTAAQELRKKRETVERVRHATPFGEIVTERPKDPRKQAPAREMLAATPQIAEAVGAKAKDLPQYLLDPGGVHRKIAESIIGPARGFAGLYLSTLLIPLNIAGVLSDEELDKAAKAIGGE